MKVKPTVANLVILAAALTVMSVLRTTVVAVSLGTLWRWFCAPQYGAGPSLSAWFGIGMMVAVIAVFAKDSRQKPNEAGATVPMAGVLYEMAAAAINLAFTCGIACGVAWTAAKAMGWL